MGMPTFVHKSGGWNHKERWEEYGNVCFSTDMTRQHYVIDQNVVNVCLYHPLASYWRDNFCEGASIAGLSSLKVMAFCTDTCWYRGESPKENSGSHMRFLGSENLCGQTSHVTTQTNYWSKAIGKPQA